MEDILSRLRQYRAYTGLKQGDFAKRLKIPQTSYSQIETGVNPINERHIALICNEFGINENWFRTGEGKFSMESVNDRMKILRKDLKMTEEEFAQKLHIPVAQVSEIESSKIKVPEKIMTYLCTPDLFRSGLGVNYFWLKYGEESEETSNNKQHMFIESPKIIRRPTIGQEGEILEGDEAELIEIFRELNKDGRRDILDYADKILELQTLRGDKEDIKPAHGKNRA